MFRKSSTCRFQLRVQSSLDEEGANCWDSALLQKLYLSALLTGVGGRTSRVLHYGFQKENFAEGHHSRRQRVDLLILLRKIAREER